MASLLDIEKEFLSPWQLDYATEGKAAPALNIVYFLKKIITIWGALPLRKL